MSYVFISYSRSDVEYARKLNKDFKLQGFSTWIDDNIESGDRWFKAIEEAIKACAAVIVIMTPTAESSQWVQKELMIAEGGKKLIFPLLLAGNEFTILIDTQYTNVTNHKVPTESFYVKLSRAAQRRIPISYPASDPTPSPTLSDEEAIPCKLDEVIRHLMHTIHPELTPSPFLTSLRLDPQRQPDLEAVLPKRYKFPALGPYLIVGVITIYPTPNPKEVEVSSVEALPMRKN